MIRPDLDERQANLMALFVRHVQYDKIVSHVPWFSNSQHLSRFCPTNDIFPWELQTYFVSNASSPKPSLAVWWIPLQMYYCLWTKEI
jgi:hypothetical protein